MDLTYHVQTFGCQMNKHDSERVSGMLDGLGCQMVEDMAHADIVIFMTCCVREAADIRLIGQVQTMKNDPLRPGSPLSKRIIAIGGCIGQRDGAKLFEEMPHVSVVFGTNKQAFLDRIVIIVRDAGADFLRVPLNGAAIRLFKQRPFSANVTIECFGVGRCYRADEKGHHFGGRSPDQAVEMIEHKRQCQYTHTILPRISGKDGVKDQAVLKRIEKNTVSYRVLEDVFVNSRTEFSDVTSHNFEI
jgi:hypothetical protein